MKRLIGITLAVVAAAPLAAATALAARDQEPGDVFRCDTASTCEGDEGDEGAGTPRVWARRPPTTMRPGLRSVR